MYIYINACMCDCKHVYACIRASIGMISTHIHTHTHTYTQMASTALNGEIQYATVSDWGYTSDGTPGLQVSVSSVRHSHSVLLFA